jgi:hypothetical protein
MFNGAFRSFLFFGKREQIARIQHSSISLKPVPLFVNRENPNAGILLSIYESG